MNTQQPSRPVITPAMREQAARQPNTWLYVVDPIFTDSHAEVPPWGFIGGYRVDERGELTDDFSPNPNYRPSPVALRMPAPTNDVERALQLTTTGYAQGNVLLAALLQAELILFAQPQGDGLVTVEHESGRRQLQVFTSEAYLPSSWTTWQRLTGRAVAERRPTGTDLQINPTSPVKARVPGEDLVKAAGLMAPAPEPAPAQPGPPTPAAPPHTPPPDATQPVPAPAQPTQSDAGSDETPAPTTAPDSNADPTDSDFGSRFLGTLLGGAIGDALGAAVEFYPVDQIRSRYGEDGITDYDRSDDAVGAFTDDTQMTLFTLEGLIRGHIAVRGGLADDPLSAVQLAYQRWLHTQGYAWSRAAGPFLEQCPEPDGWLVGERGLFSVRSPGSAGITALREFASTGRPGTFEHAFNESDSCGGVVRAAPVALWSDDAREVFELACATAALTYSHPDGYLPAGVQAALVHRLLRGESASDAVEHARGILREHAGHEHTEGALSAAVTLAAQGQPTPERLKDALGGGWTGPEALAIAVCALLSTDTLNAAIMLAVNHSGDSDSTGAACGALAGARYGNSAIPGVWLRDLDQRETVEVLSRDALLEFGPTPPDDTAWQERYPTRSGPDDLRFDTKPPTSGAHSTRTEAITSGAATETTAEHSEHPEHAELDTPSEGADADETHPGPVARDESLDAQRVRGCLLGGGVGDALGYAIEFDSLEAIRDKYGEQGLDDFVDAHRPGGSISDDTQMTLFTLEGLIRASIRRRRYGETEPATQVQYAYQRWLHTQGFDWKDAGGPVPGSAPDGWLIAERGLFVRRAPGATCVQALHGFAGGSKPGSFTHRLNDSKGCGGVMRAAPAGLWSDDPDEVFRVGAVTGVLTHGHPSGFLPAGALAVIVQQLLTDRSLPEAVTRALDELAGWDDNLETTACIRRAVQLAADGDPSPEKIQQQLGGGWVGEEALAIAVYAALTHPTSFSDAIVLAANHAGDSDSTAAVCGNIMGAALGCDAIPDTWLDRLELREVIEQLAADAVREFGPNPPDEAEWLHRYPVDGADAGPTTSPDVEVAAAKHGDVAPEPQWTPPEALVQDDSDYRDHSGEVAAPGEFGPHTDRATLPSNSIWAGAVVNHVTNATELADEAARTSSDDPSDADAAPGGDADDGDTDSTVEHAGSDEDVRADDPIDPSAEAVAPSPVDTAAAAEEAESASRSASETSSSGETESSGESLSEEEIRLLSAWRRFREGADDVPDEVSEGLRTLLVEAFGPERATQLAGENPMARRSGLVTETPLDLDLTERLAGCVLGTAVGDSLGAPWMLADLDWITRKNPDGITAPAEVFGRRGAATAITQQTAFVLDGLLRAEVRGRSRGTGPHRAPLVRAALQLWLAGLGGGFVPAIGTENGPGSALLGAHRFPDEASITALSDGRRRSGPPTPDDPPNQAHDAAAAARGAVVGLFATTPKSAVTLGAEVGVITHGSPDGYLPAGALAGLVRALADGATLAAAIDTVLAELDGADGGAATAAGLRSAVERAEAGDVTPESLEKLVTDRSAPTALSVATAAALAHPESYPDAVALSAAHSGNSAATAAICGSLLGTSRGASSIPADWLDELELREILDSLLTDVGRVSEVKHDQLAPEWARRYLAID